MRQDKPFHAMNAGYNHPLIGMVVAVSRVKWRQRRDRPLIVWYHRYLQAPTGDRIQYLFRVKSLK